MFGQLNLFFFLLDSFSSLFTSDPTGNGAVSSESLLGSSTLLDPRFESPSRIGDPSFSHSTRDSFDNHFISSTNIILRSQRSTLRHLFHTANMPGEEIDRPNPQPLPSQIDDHVLKLTVNLDKTKLDESTSTGLQKFRRAANYIAAGESLNPSTIVVRC